MITGTAVKVRHAVLVNGLSRSHDVGAVGCESLGDFFYALGCNVAEVELERFDGGVR